MDIMFWVTDLLIPLLIFILGIGFYNVGSTDINNWLGYRTRRSKSSQEAWDFAQKEMARLFIIISLISGFIVVFDKLWAPLEAEWLSMINMSVEVVLIILVIPIVEHKLKKKFNLD